MEISTRADALAIGALRYFSGTPCGKGHVAERMTINRRCVICSRENAKAFAARNPERVKATKARYDERRRSDLRTWMRHMVTAIRSRARKDGIPFDLTEPDLFALMPSEMICPVLGIPIIVGGGLSPNSPSVDRHRPRIGYVRGNVAIISNRANTLKRDCTDPAELRAVAEYVERVCRSAA
jgi:hypothetical protein